MEDELHKRDHIGVQDFVLLEDFTNPEAFVENLRKRFNENLIYVSIMHVPRGIREKSTEAIQLGSYNKCKYHACTQRHL